MTHHYQTTPLINRAHSAPAYKKEKTMTTTIVLVDKMLNENGNQYGTNYIIFAESEDNAWEWKQDNFSDEELFGSHDVWDQLQFEVVIPKDNEPFVKLLAAFVGKKATFGDIKSVIEMADLWEPNQYSIF